MAYLVGGRNGAGRAVFGPLQADAAASRAARLQQGGYQGVTIRDTRTGAVMGLARFLQELADFR